MNCAESPPGPAVDSLPARPAAGRPLGSALATLFPTPVRYTGTSLAFNFAGILGASIAAPIATYLAKHYGLAFVGYYLSTTALISLIALMFIKGETK